MTAGAPAVAQIVSPVFRSRVSRDFARLHRVVGIEGDAPGQMALLVSNETPRSVIHNLSVHVAQSLPWTVADDAHIAQLIDAAYEDGQGKDVEADDLATDDALEDLIASADRDLLHTEGKAPVVRLVDAILFQALSHGASDVHIHPNGASTLVRYRMDGVLHTVREVPASVTNAILSRVKVMGRMDIAERRVPQDGRATVNIGERPIDLRISTVPTSFGERAVLRLLDHNQQLTDFGALGMPKDVAAAFQGRASRTNGLVLVTGPTGSGKTTTLYSTLRTIGSSALNIMTIEDPIEYELASAGLTISQSQVNPRKGVTFDSGLRHLLRQDPDVVMVGEVRDGETAKIAVQASLTGHLVLTTLHTNDAPSAVSRMIDLGVEPYLVSASLSAVLAQRLVRRVHAACAGRGCDTCMDTGFRGRTGVFELLIVDDPMRSAISRNAPLEVIRETAREAGMQTLAGHGRTLVEAGTTTRDELLRAVEIGSQSP